MYFGVRSNLPARVRAHREGRGSRQVSKRSLHRLVWADFTSPVEEAIAHEKRIKRWHRPWKFALIEAGNPEWEDLFERLNG